MSDDAAVIHTRGLTRDFGARRAVDGVDMEVRRGEIFGFLGTNGAGKSTVIRMLCGILTPTAGEGRVLGVDITTNPEGVKPLIGYMTQRFSLYEDLTMGENLRFYGEIYGVTGGALESRLEELAREAQLGGRWNQLAGELSGGWKQRLALACALVHRPRLLFLDEPTAGVDPESRNLFWVLIAGLAAKGTTVLVTTHDMEEAARCHRVAFMKAGRLLALDRPDRLVAAIPLRILEVAAEPAEALPALASEIPDLFQVRPLGIVTRFSAPRGAALEPSLRSAAAAAGLRLSGVREVSPDLQDVFTWLSARNPR